MTTVTIYTRPNCQPCRASKRWLNERSIEFTEERADNPDNAAAIKYLGYLQAPVVIVAKDGPGSEVHWSGFNPVELDRHLGSEAKANG